MHLSVKLGKEASIGIGAMIVFIAMVLVAGIAASVLIQTSTSLESQSMSSGRETIAEVSTGLTVSAIEGYAASGSDISKIAILVRPRAGTDSVDISSCFLELSDASKKVILNYTSSYYSKPSTGLDNIFNANVFPDFSGDGSASRFGILVMNDPDNSISSSTPRINRYDKVYICLNTTAVFSDIGERTNIWGMLVPEEGAPASIEFTTPGSYSDPVMELFWDM
jgi:flagellin FlaB